MAPQPSVVLTEEVLLDLSTATGEIEQKFTRDDQVQDLYKVITTQKNSQNYSNIFSNQLPMATARSPFIRKNILPLPDAILDQYQSIFAVSLHLEKNMVHFRII
jgi:hypothetical protein